MKRFHFPTLAMHLLLLLLARYTISDYPDFFMGTAILVLIIHIVWAIGSRENFLLAHCMGIFLYRLSEMLGFVQIGNGFFGMGGEFAWFFYGVALAISFVIHSIICILRRTPPASQ